MRLGDRERLQLVPPPEDDRFFVYLPQVHLDAGFELRFGRNAYAAQQGLGHLPEEGFDQVQPRTMGGREGWVPWPKSGNAGLIRPSLRQ